MVGALACRPAVPEPTSTPAAPEAPKTVAFRLLKQGAYGKAATRDVTAPGAETPKVELAATPARYQELWNTHIGDTIPEVDFSRESVIFLLLGTKPTGGYAVQPQAVRLTNSQDVRVEAAVASPSRNSAVTMAFTAPFAVIAVATPQLRSAEWVGGDGTVLARVSKPSVR